MTPANVNTPVTNPALAAALTANAQHDTPDTRREVTRELMQATFLVVILTQEVQETPGEAPGQVTWQPGSHFSVLLAGDGQGGRMLPLFSDWEALRQWTDEPVSGLLMPAAEAWVFALVDDTYSGVVLNPATDCLTYRRPALAQLAGRAA